jgi:hypothetical protein
MERGRLIWEVGRQFLPMPFSSSYARLESTSTI